MKKWLIVFITLLTLFCFKTGSAAYAQEKLNIQITPIACRGTTPCPNVMDDIYKKLPPDSVTHEQEKCVQTYDEFLQKPYIYHYWAEDPEITSQGRADERARQFIYWAINVREPQQTAPVLTGVWNTTRNVAYIFVILMAAIMGLGFIIGQRTSFNLKIQLWPTIIKIALALLYITFSAFIVIQLIQLSDVVMKFFIENLGGKNLFNIYFDSTSGSSIDNYTSFVGCRDLNMRVQEAVTAETWLLKATNVTYYVMGIMLLLRKVLLWFLLFVAPFLAILMPFVFIRNIGWIWIGVFFQWLCYGPLFAIFLGGLNQIWKNGIPFIFDFSRVNDATLSRHGYIYPTAINLFYGGPAQRAPNQAISALNNGNYVDTFAEYIITLIMLWAVVFFPWWLLRIFRDYCCDGIYAMKNILLSMYDQMRSGPPPGSPQGPRPSPTSFKTNIDMRTPREVETVVRVKLETLEEIKKSKTEEITKSMNLSATKLTDIARFETDKTTHENVTKNLNLLSNPTKAQTPAERQKYMNIRTELFNRAIKNDTAARQILSATSTSTIERLQKRDELVKSISNVNVTKNIQTASTPVNQAVSVKVQMPTQKVASITNNLVTSITNNNNVVNNISQETKASTQEVQTVLNSFKNQSSQLTNNTIQNIAKETGISKEKVTKVVKHITEVVKTNKELVKEVAQKENVNEEQVQKVVDNQIPAVVQAEKPIEQNITIPPTVSIEDYEEVKKMWTSQYEKGEVPVTENITSREDWVDQDIIFITNTLNKLVSTDEKLKQEGVDELAYILPIFIINNMKGEELLVYLKAKLEAAKSVRESMQKEKELTEKIKAQAEGEKVEVERPKEQEAQKELHMELDEDKPQDTPKEMPVEPTQPPSSTPLSEDTNKKI